VLRRNLSDLDAERKVNAHSSRVGRIDTAPDGPRTVPV